METTSVRIDKWLWAARFFKTRSLAARASDFGRIQSNHQPAKPAQIKGRDDGKVSVESTKVEGMRDHLIVHSTHPFMIENRRVIASVMTFLKSGQFRPKGTEPVAAPNGD